MEALFHVAPFTGYVYPNETIIPWTVLIVIYPYLTGLVAGAFTMSSLYQVFGMQRFKPVAHFAMLTSLCCMLIVPLPLLLHLGHPERALNPMITPHTTSAFAVFGYAAAFYLVLLLLEVEPVSSSLSVSMSGSAENRSKTARITSTAAMMI